MSRVEPTCYRHPERVTYVSCTRCGRSICGEDQIPASVGFHCPEDVRAAAAGARQARSAFGGRLSSGTDVTYGLILVNVVVFAATALGGASALVGGGDSELYRLFALAPVALQDGGQVTPGVVDGQYWRLGTAMFLHYGSLHLILNMLALFQLGPELERALGRLRFAALYLICGVAGSAGSYAFGPENARSAGASGAIYGLAGAWFLLARRRGLDATPVLGFIGVGLLLSVTIPAIDLRAHVGGLLAGLACGTALFLSPRGPARPRLQAIGLLIVVLVVAGVVAARTDVLDGSADGSGGQALTVLHVDDPRLPMTGAPGR